MKRQIVYRANDARPAHPGGRRHGACEKKGRPVGRKLIQGTDKIDRVRTAAPYFLAAMALVALIASGPIRATNETPGPRFSITDATSVPDAVQRIQAVLVDQGFEIIATVDHAANAAGVGLDLRPVTVILARERRTDARIIARSQTAAIDLPFKFLVWRDDTGAIRLAFNDIGYLVDRHDIDLKDSKLRRLDQYLEQFGDQDRGLNGIKSTRSVKDTVARLRRALETTGFLVPAVIDFQADSGRAGGSLRPTTLIVFGNPRIGTPLMQNRQEVGIDLPQKFLVWEDVTGQVRITWNDPFFVARRAGVQGLETLLIKISETLAGLAASGADT